MVSHARPLDGLTDWAGNRHYGATGIHEPASLDALQEIVRGARSIRVLGSRHSFSAIADTTGELVSLRAMPRIFELDPLAMTLRIDGATRYGELAAPLHAAGFALHSLASLPHISVAGACATATHGSGDRLGNLATAVSAMDLVRADGELVTLSRSVDADALDAAVVGLGALGVVVSLTLDVQPTYRVRQDVYERLPLRAAVEHFDAITALADSISLFTDWRGPVIDQVWLKRRVPDGDPYVSGPTLLGATLATAPIHPIRRMPTAALTAQLGVPGPWHERLPHFRMDHTPSAGAEIQSEYLIPRQHAPEALVAIDAVREAFAPVLQISEVRTIAADRLWMSTAYGRPSVGIHFTWAPEPARVLAVLPVIEQALAPFTPRPHWGKVSTMSHDTIAPAYERLPAFVALAETLDPSGMFQNAFLRDALHGAP